jgi:uncharacterized protein (TIGR00255 family)
MDFLLQEIHREVNTVSAKANDAEISQRVVEIKAELEKIRERKKKIGARIIYVQPPLDRLFN